MREFNEKYEKINLNKEYFKAYMKIALYISSFNLEDSDKEMVRDEIIDMLQESQVRGESVKDLITDGYVDFCENIINALPLERKKRKNVKVLKAFVYYYILYFSITFIPKLFENDLGFKIIFEKVGITLGMVIGTLIGAISVYLIGKNIFKIMNKKYWIEIILYFILLILSVFITASNSLILLQVPLIIIVLIEIVLLTCFFKLHFKLKKDK